MHDLQNYVAELDEKIHNEQEFTNSIAKNTKILFNDSSAIAVKTDIISNDFRHFKYLSTCAMFRLVSKVTRQRLFSKVESMFNDIISGLLTPRVLPISLLKDIVKDARLIEGTLLELDPLAFYSQSTISLVSIDKSKHTVELLLATPKVNKVPTYTSLNVLSTKATVLSDGKPISMRLKRPADLFLPMQMLENNHGFPLNSKLDAQKIKRLNGCSTVNGRKVCRNVVPIDRDDQICIQAMVANVSSEGACHVSRTFVDKVPEITVDQGTSGILVSAPATYTIYGTRFGRKERLMLSPPTAPGTKSCLFVPARYDTIELTDGRKTEVIRQHINVQTDHLDTTVEGAFYPFESEMWNTDPLLEKNLTLTNIDRMVRKTVSGHFRNGGVTWQTVILSCVSLLLFLALLLMAGIYLGVINPRRSGGQLPAGIGGNPA